MHSCCLLAIYSGRLLLLSDLQKNRDPKVHSLYWLETNQLSLTENSTEESSVYSASTVLGGLSYPAQLVVDRGWQRLDRGCTPLPSLLFSSLDGWQQLRYSDGRTTAAAKDGSRTFFLFFSFSPKEGMAM
jgi:hypothetical protein